MSIPRISCIFSRRLSSLLSFPNRNHIQIFTFHRAISHSDDTWANAPVAVVASSQPIKENNGSFYSRITVYWGRNDPYNTEGQLRFDESPTHVHVSLTALLIAVRQAIDGRNVRKMYVRLDNEYFTEVINRYLRVWKLNGYKKRDGSYVKHIDLIQDLGRLTDVIDIVVEHPRRAAYRTPVGIIVDLMPHQKEGLTWLLWRENEENAGGILADDMGLGKTLSMISLIVQQKNLRLEKCNEEPQRMPQQFEGLTLSKTILVVAPASLVYQWESEIHKFVEPGKLRVATFYGNNREADPEILASNDVVLTTYGVLESELTAKDLAYDGVVMKSRKEWIPNKESVLARIAWERIILDEAHNIKNRRSNRARA